jgi:RNA polymerase sigma-70 factor (ECF subfamily)
MIAFGCPRPLIPIPFTRSRVERNGIGRQFEFNDSQFSVVMSRNLNEIVTNWDELFSASARNGSASSPVLTSVLQRYFGAVWNYLASVVKDEHVADDLTQEFAIRFLRGDFHDLHPDKGRFRDFLKVILRNMVIDHFRRQKELPVDIDLQSICDPQVSAADQYDELFVEHWRQDLLQRTWNTFRNAGSRRGALYYEALYQFAESGGMNSGALAEKLSACRGEPVSAATARQILHRARQMFADLLREEVRQSLAAEASDADAVEEELCELRLTKYLGSFPANRSPK